MNIGSSDRIAKYLRYVLLSLGILFVLVFIIIAMIRIRYPFELEWTEGALVDHVSWLLSGHKLYVPPTIEFVPYLYTPLYFYVGAALSQITGVGFFPLRLLSFVASLGCIGIIYLFVKRETKSIFAGFLAASFFVATYRLGGSWFDVARIDMMFLLFFLMAIYLIRFHETWQSYLLAGIFVTLSFLTKQTALLYSIPIGFYCIIRRPKLGIFFVGSAAVLIVGSSVILDRIHDGWFNYYVFKLAPHHYLLRHRIIFYWIEDLLAPLPVASAFAIFYFVRRLVDSFKKEGLFYLLTSAGIMSGVWLTRMHDGAYVNVLIPAYAMIAILFGLGVHRVMSYAKEIAGKAAENISANLRAFVLFICVVQFAALLYNPAHEIPTRADVQAGREFIQTISKIEGDIWIPAHGFLPTMAGKKSFAHAGSIGDVFKADRGPVAKKLYDEIVNAIGNQKFTALILDKSDYKFMIDISPYYGQEQRIFLTDRVFWTLTGQRTRPEIIYYAKNDTRP
jgi:4-amino-4-deoxy-L-arabinose transferase-like glycosyltransferase